MADEHRVPKPHQEWDQGERCLIGRDPRRSTVAELRACGIKPQPLLAVIRAKCLDCVGNNAAEVRRCGDAEGGGSDGLGTGPWRSARPSAPSCRQAQPAEGQGRARPQVARGSLEG